jgi:hypothetical protein
MKAEKKTRKNTGGNNVPQRYGSQGQPLYNQRKLVYKREVIDPNDIEEQQCNEYITKQADNEGEFFRLMMNIGSMRFENSLVSKDIIALQIQGRQLEKMSLRNQYRK